MSNTTCSTCGPSKTETRRLPGETCTMWADRLVANGTADLDQYTRSLVERHATKSEDESEEGYW